MFIILASPIALYLTALMLLFIVFGFKRRTFQASLFLLAFILLITAAGTAMVAGNEAAALLAQGKDPQRMAQDLAIGQWNVWIQALGWPVFAGTLALYWRHRKPAGA